LTIVSLQRERFTLAQLAHTDFLEKAPGRLTWQRNQAHLPSFPLYLPSFTSYSRLIAVSTLFPLDILIRSR
jgi:hypothetical protein